MPSFNTSSPKLISILKKYDVTAAYLFGSHTTGKTHAKSDIDIAVRFAKDLSLKKILEVTNELTLLLKKPVDLIDLQSAPLPLQFRIYRARKRIYAANPKVEVLLCAKALCLYYDYKYYFDRFARFEMDRIVLKGLT